MNNSRKEYSETDYRKKIRFGIYEKQNNKIMVIIVAYDPSKNNCKEKWIILPISVVKGL